MFWINPDGFDSSIMSVGADVLNEIQASMPVESQNPAFSLESKRYRGHPQNIITDAQHFIGKEIWICTQNDEIIISGESISFPYPDSMEADFERSEYIAPMPRFFILEDDMPLGFTPILRVLDTTSETYWDLDVAYSQSVEVEQKRRTLTDGKYDIWESDMDTIKVRWQGFRVIDAEYTFPSSTPEWFPRNLKHITLQWSSKGKTYPTWNLSTSSGISKPAFPVFLNEKQMFYYSQILNWSMEDSKTLIQGGLL